MRPTPRAGLVVAATALSHGIAGAVDLTWHAPNATVINSLTNVLSSTGVYGFVYNNSYPTDVPYGTYDWCNMPHVRKEEYKKPAAEYKLKYVELIHRHHKRTVYASNSFPVESYGWNCDDESLFYYGQPTSGNKSAHTYWNIYTSNLNPFLPSGFVGSCQFPQITGQGLDDALQHGRDLYGVYHDLLNFIPDEASKKVAFRVTTNQITSQVAGMVINGMFKTQDNIPLRVQASGIDSLEPTYSCSSASTIYNSIKSSSDWNNHLTAASSLYSTLDNISGVNPTDGGFHASFDHYYDNLSARQCHAKPLPCKLVNGANSTTCVTQDIANEVYRFGNWEYSYIYRDSPTSLNAAVGSMGIWVAELAANIRDVIAGKSEVIYRHNVAHDGSMSRLLSFLQVDVMVWPGMGSEVVFEVYEKTSGTTVPTTMATVASTVTILQCGEATTTAPPTSVPTGIASPSLSGHYVRVLWGGKVLRSSSPALGLLDMVPLEQVMAYIDGLVGVGGSLVLGKCNGTISY